MTTVRLLPPRCGRDQRLNQRPFRICQAARIPLLVSVVAASVLSRPHTVSSPESVGRRRVMSDYRGLICFQPDTEVSSLTPLLPPPNSEDVLKLSVSTGPGMLSTDRLGSDINSVTCILERRKSPRKEDEMTARILIVDDVAANVRLLSAKLAAEYYQIRVAYNGVHALEVAEDWQPDLILLDVMMPGMDGYECCQRLKNSGLTSHIPIIMVSALGEPVERNSGLKVGADDFLTKPVDYDTLMARVRSLIRLKRVLDEWRVRSTIAESLGLEAEENGGPSIYGTQALIVDDWAKSATHFAEILREEGLVSVYALSSDHAIKLMDTMRFGLIIVNMSLADDDPLRLIGQIRAQDNTYDTPLLIVSEQSDKPRVLRGFELGVNDCLMQPIDPHELRARARNQVTRKVYQDRMRSNFGAALEMAFVDHLTGLYNQRYLRRHLEQMLEAARFQTLAVLMIDIDHFKNVNDCFGHQSGDQALRLVGESLKVNTRAIDLVARYGGEEFTVVMTDVLLDDVINAAERLRGSVERISFEVGRKKIHLTISVGIAYSNDLTVDPMALVDRADLALYKAKANGRNRIEQYPNADLL